jgi:hypothetical protein
LRAVLSLDVQRAGVRTNTRTERDARRRAAYARQRAQREAAAVRNAVREDARAAAQRAAQAIEALEDGWGGRTRALNELDELSHALVQLQHEELKLRTQRDELIDALRAVGASWTLLALRTRLSRQALIKRRGVADVSERA